VFAIRIVPVPSAVRLPPGLRVWPPGPGLCHSLCAPGTYPRNAKGATLSGRPASSRAILSSAAPLFTERYAVVRGRYCPLAYIIRDLLRRCNRHKRGAPRWSQGSRGANTEGWGGVETSLSNSCRQQSSMARRPCQRVSVAASGLSAAVLAAGLSFSTLAMMVSRSNSR
jgi:hypothetical protein